MREATAATATATTAHRGDPDVLFYGSSSVFDRFTYRDPACIDWTGTLPWVWYLRAADASVTCRDANGDGLPQQLPPVVIAEGECALDRPVRCRAATEELRAPADLRDRTGDDYVRYGFVHRTTGGNDFNGMVVFVRTDLAPPQSASARAFRSQRGPALRYSASPTAPARLA
jgi:predicted membrane-bound mannosyltransferase